MRPRTLRPGASWPTFALAFTLALAAPSAAVARTEGPGDGDDPIAQLLFPPELVLGHSQEIGLDDTQRKAVRTETQSAQHRFLDLQLDLQEQGETLARLLKSTPVEEKAVLTQVDRVLEIEREIKRTQITLLVRIKNLLRPEQLARLTALRGGEG